MRGEITKQILEFIAEGVVGSIDLLELFITSGRNSSSRRFNKALYTKSVIRNQKEIEARIRQNFYNRMHALKKDGLIEKNESHETWQMTTKGKKRLHLFKKEMAKTPPNTQYPSLPSDEFKIIVFDIPEKERGKRDWLRARLVQLGFTLLQKSVWIGKKQIPEQFINDLGAYDIFNYVEILAITKQGTIKKIQ
ncbi:MAG: hypothetical protein HZA35_02770 [Parcubacteria group bacterium]|nr:hypothetical protein [Parcubacteria group bacterium]